MSGRKAATYVVGFLVDKGFLRGCSYKIKLHHTINFMITFVVLVLFIGLPVMLLVGGFIGARKARKIAKGLELMAEREIEEKKHRG